MLNLVYTNINIRHLFTELYVQLGKKKKKNVMCTHLDLPEQIHTKNKERDICSIVNGSSPVCRHLMFFFLCFPLFIAISLSPLIPLHYYIPFDWSQKMPDKSIKLCEVRELLIYYYYYECCRCFFN